MGRGEIGIGDQGARFERLVAELVITGGLDGVVFVEELDPVFVENC